jgi:flagellar assembly protein FliH
MNTSNDDFRPGFSPDSGEESEDSAAPRPFQFPELTRASRPASLPAEGFAPLRFASGRELRPGTLGPEEIRRREAEREAAAARAEAEAIRAEAREEGFAEGREAAEAGAAELLGRLSEALEELDQRRDALLRQAERGAVALALTIARRVVAREVSADPELVRGIVAEALGELDHPDQLTIRVHPGAMNLLDPAQIAARAGLESVAILPDAAISPGGCRLETGLGELDARMNTRLEEIAKALEARL